VGFILKLVLILIIARLVISAFKLLLGGGQRKRRASPDPVQDKRQRARRKLDEDIVEAEFEDLTEDKHKRG